MHREILLRVTHELICNSFPLILRVKAACFHLTIKVLLHARVLTLICACPIFKANFSHYNFPNAYLRNKFLTAVKAICMCIRVAELITLSVRKGITGIPSTVF